jgi:flagellar motility protein MotE (MotC chaperone)
VIRNVFDQAGSDYQHLKIKLNDRMNYLQTNVSELALKIQSQTQKLVESISSMDPNNAASTHTQSTYLTSTPKLVPTVFAAE